MTVKEFLKKVREQDLLLRTYEQELEDLKRRAYSISSPSLGDKVQSNHIGSLDEIVEKLELQGNKVNREWDKLIEMRDQAREMISTIETTDCKTVLYRRYILCEEWEQIAVKMCFDLRYVYKLHGKGLKEIEKRTLKDTKRH